MVSTEVKLAMRLLELLARETGSEDFRTLLTLIQTWLDEPSVEPPAKK